MQQENFIKVLWVEDDPQVTETYPLEAESYELQLEPYPCWDDAKAALEGDFDGWSAIILDAKCKFHRDSADNAVIFLREALKDISVICNQKGRIIPWYVLTGGAETEVSDSINDERLKWDKDWTDSKHKKYYSKAEDRDFLYRRIKYHAQISPRTQIQDLYGNVLKAMRECEIDEKARFALEDLLVPIHFSERIIDDTNDKYNDNYVKVRTVLEYIFRSMSSHGLLPNWGQVNLQWSSCIISGMNAYRKDKNGKDVVVIESKRRIISPVLQKVLKEMVRIVPAFCHSDNEEEGEIKKEEYLDSVSNSTLLLKSFTFQLCDIILWCQSYYREHPDIEENTKAWEIKESQYLKLKKNGSK